MRELYSRRELGIVCYTAGLLTGLIVAFASCAPDPHAARDHITTGGQQ